MEITHDSFIQLFNVGSWQLRNIIRVTDSCSSAAVSEAAYMTGLERNADIVIAAAYAPTLAVRVLSFLVLMTD